MDLSKQKEHFSIAYLGAVTATAGFGIGESKPDDDSVDVTVHAKGFNDTPRSRRLDIQLKCTSRLEIEDGNSEYRFPLGRKNYDDLRGLDHLVPRILVVVLVPQNVEDWMD